MLIRAATTALLLKKETSRADELAGKVERLEATLKDLIDALFAAQSDQLMDAARLPEVFDVDGLSVRVFPPRTRQSSHLPQSERRAIPAIVRRVYAAAAKYAGKTPECLICEASAPIEGRALIAVEAGGEQDIGCVCGVCAGLSAPSAAA